MKLSIEATLYQSAPNIGEFYRRATEAAKSLTDDYEIVIVNDGSPDDSPARAVHLTELDSHVVVVDHLINCIESLKQKQYLDYKDNLSHIF